MAGPSQLKLGERVRSFPARSFNLLVADWYRRLAERGTSRGFTGPGQYTIVKAVNATGVALKYGDAVAIEQLQVAVADDDALKYRRPVLKAQLNSSTLKHSIMGVALTQIADGQPGSFVVAGVAWVRTDVTDTAHSFTKLPAEQTEPKAESGTDGYPILDRESDATGEQLVLALIGSGSGGGGSVDIDIVLVDKDITGVVEDDPPTSWTADNFPLTQDEIDAGLTLVLQEPPDDDPTVNLLDDLNAWGFKRSDEELKIYRPATKQVITTGTMVTSTSDTITLASDASDEVDFYNGKDIVVTGEGGAYRETGKITDYDGPGHIATVDPPWSPTPTGFGSYEYEVSLRDPGYEEDADGNPKPKFILATTTTDIPGASEGDPDTRVVRYLTGTFQYFDGKDFKTGDYTREDYPDYPENESFPPDGTGTYPEQPEGYLKKRVRVVAINKILIVAMCEDVPPPALQTSSS